MPWIDRCEEPPCEIWRFADRRYAAISTRPIEGIGYIWLLSDGRGRVVKRGAEQTLEKAQNVVEAEIPHMSRKNGRKFTGGEPISSSERSMRHRARPAAQELANEKAHLSERLEHLHECLKRADKLISEGGFTVPGFPLATQLRAVLRKTAILALAEFVKRTPKLFIRYFELTENEEERIVDEILKCAYNIETLASDELSNEAGEHLDSIRRRLCSLGYIPDEKLFDAAKKACGLSERIIPFIEENPLLKSLPQEGIVTLPQETLDSLERYHRLGQQEADDVAQLKYSLYVALTQQEIVTS